MSLKAIKEVNNPLGNFLRTHKFTKPKFLRWAERLEMDPEDLAGLVIGDYEPSLKELRRVAGDTGIFMESLCQHLELCDLTGPAELTRGVLEAAGELEIEILFRGTGAAKWYTNQDFTRNKIRLRCARLGQEQGIPTGLRFPGHDRLLFQVTKSRVTIPHSFHTDELFIYLDEIPRVGSICATLRIGARVPLNIVTYGRNNG